MTWPRVDGLRTLELGTPGEVRQRLNALVLAGRKCGTAGLRREYDVEGEALEHVGEVLVLVDDAGAEVGRVEVTSVDVVPFGEVTSQFARSEGEGDEDAEAWRRSHARYWQRQGEAVDDATPVVCLGLRLLVEQAPAP